MKKPIKGAASFILTYYTAQPNPWYQSQNVYFYIHVQWHLQFKTTVMRDHLSYVTTLIGTWTYISILLYHQWKTTCHMWPLLGARSTVSNQWFHCTVCTRIIWVYLFIWSHVLYGDTTSKHHHLIYCQSIFITSQGPEKILSNTFTYLYLLVPNILEAVRLFLTP